MIGENNMELYQELLKIIWTYRPELNFIDSFGRTALHHAAKAGNYFATEFILCAAYYYSYNNE